MLLSHVDIHEKLTWLRVKWSKTTSICINTTTFNPHMTLGETTRLNVWYGIFKFTNYPDSLIEGLP